MQLKDATILVVDDETDLRSILAEWFRRESCRVLVAEDGAEALNLIERNRIDLIVSDVRMPVMDGITMLRSVKANESYTPSVMFISGFTDFEPRESYDLGVEAVMSKPVERKALMAVVTRMLADRDELWRVPPADKTADTLDAAFEGLAAALSQNAVAFGRGGFCIHSILKLKEGPVNLLLEFRADKRRVTGRGMVRWTALAESQIGVEIMHIADDNRAWVISLTEPNKSVCFIPRTTAVAATATTVGV